MELVKYDAMCQQLAECRKFDEVAEMRNQANALAGYARQAKNMDAERNAIEIRIRAERRAGQLLGGMEKSKGGDAETLRSEGGARSVSEFKQAKSESGVSDDQGKKWQNLAKVSDGDFEKAMGSDEMPSTAGILRSVIAKPKGDVRPIDDRAIALWGICKRFNETVKPEDLDYLLGELTESMRKSVFLEVEKAVETCNLILTKGS